MKTIFDLEGNKWEYDDCLSCAIKLGQVKPFGGIIYESRSFILMQDFSRPIVGFMVISAKRHVETYDALTNEERIELSELIYKTQRTLKDLKICDYFNIYVAEYQEGHFHLQILPRYKYMEDERGTIIGNLNRGFKYAKDNLSTKDSFVKINEALQKIREKMNK